MYFTSEEFIKKYSEYSTTVIEDYKIEYVCEMILSKIGLIYRREWNKTNVPSSIKRASMEQLRFMLEHDIPFVDFDKKLKAGSMEAELKSDYSTLALRILANNGYLYRGNPVTQNMGINLPFGGQ